jgi:hypothetical protein
MSLFVDPDLAEAYALALVAIARAEGTVGLEDGLRLAECVARRCPQPMAIDDLMLALPMHPARFAELVYLASSPFRGAGVHPRELARMLVADGLAVLLARGHIADVEAALIVEFATALGCGLDELRAMSPHLGTRL